MDDRILLFSGGMDSLIAWFYLNKPKCIYVDLHHRYSQQELSAVDKIKSKHPEMYLIIDDRLNLADYEEEDANIPMRNLFLFMVASYHAEIVYTVFQHGEQSLPDRSSAFMEKASQLVSSLHGKRREFVNVFQNVSKSDMVKWYIEKGHDVNLFKDSVSCYDKSVSNCGACSSCFRKWIALESNGVKCLDWFFRDLTKWEGTLEYKKKMLSGQYDKDRTEKTLEVLQRYGI